jgi:Endonuclease NucS
MSLEIQIEPQEFKFEDENALETFIEANLDKLFGIQAIARQYRVGGEICDLLAIDRDRALTIIELKNAEDRYVVQQISRYYHSFYAEKPFFEQINYTKPIRLIVISPIFHRHNFVDLQYNQLDIDFIRFVITKSKNSYSLQLLDLESNIINQIVIDPHDHTLKKQTNDSETEAQELINFYVRNKYAQSLDIRELTVQEKIDNLHRNGKPSKIFKIRMNPVVRTNNYKYILVKVPSKITIAQFMYWVIENVPRASAILTANGKSYLLNRPR